MEVNEKQVWEMTLSEWMSHPRSWETNPQKMDLSTWRSANGYPNPMEEHGSLRYPHGISKTERRRIEKHLAERFEKMEEGARKYRELDAEGKIPMQTYLVEYNGPEEDRGNIIAMARIRHKRAVKLAVKNGVDVPEKVLADYPDLPGVVREQSGSDEFVR